MVRLHPPAPSSHDKTSRGKSPLLLIDGSREENGKEDGCERDVNIDSEEFDFSEVFGALPSQNQLGTSREIAKFAFGMF
jgi:hypothetical protein